MGCPLLKVRARATDPETSHAAAASISTEELRASQHDVLKAMKVLGRGTDQRLVWVYRSMAEKGWVRKQSESGIRTRRKELVAKGAIKDSGQRAVLDTGRKAVIWEVSTWH